MPRFHSFFYLLPELWRTLVKDRITVAYPLGPLELPAYFRGRVTVDPDLCIGCGLCVRDCPASALQLERDGTKFRLVHYRDRCAYCGQCEESCRQGAIRLVADFAPAAPRRDALCDVLVEKERPKKG